MSNTETEGSGVNGDDEGNTESESNMDWSISKVGKNQMRRYYMVMILTVHSWYTVYSE